MVISEGMLHSHLLPSVDNSGVVNICLPRGVGEGKGVVISHHYFNVNPCINLWEKYKHVLQENEAKSFAFFICISRLYLETKLTDCPKIAKMNNLPFPLFSHL